MEPPSSKSGGVASEFTASDSPPRANPGERDRNRHHQSADHAPDAIFEYCPKLEMRDDGIPGEYMAAVVVPTLLGSLHAVEEALEHIEVQYLANRDPNLQLRDAQRPHRLADRAPGGRQSYSRRGIIPGIRTLNSKYASGGKMCSSSSIAPAVESKSQSLWMGWERKRGKLARFNRFLRGGARNVFSTVVGDTTRLGKVRYVHHARFRHRPATRPSATPRGKHRTPAQPGAVRSKSQSRITGKDTAYSSRASAFLSRARTNRSSRPSTRGIRASIRTPLRYPTFIRISSAKAASPERGSTMSMPSRTRHTEDFRKTLSSATT